MTSSTLQIKPPRFWEEDIDGKVLLLPKKENTVHKKSVAPLTVDMLSADQRTAYDTLKKWCQNEDDGLIRLGGYAGTGKSTLITLLARTVLQEKCVAYCAFSGKAGSILRQKFAAAGILSRNTHCGTIHSLIYIPIQDPKTGELIGFTSVDDLKETLIVVDEASMLGEKLWTDLRSYNVKILAVGDHGQLPPVGSGSINLLQDADLRLEKIHRQAEGNPILALAAYVRNGGNPATFKVPSNTSNTKSVRIVKNLPSRQVHLMYKNRETFFDKIILCYSNKTRNLINRWARNFLGLFGEPKAGDAVICLKNAIVKGVPIFNGMRGIIHKIEDDPASAIHFRATIDFPDDGLRLENGRLFKAQFGAIKTIGTFEQASKSSKTKIVAWRQVGLLFDYAYAMTVHKAQGSQFDTVLVVNEQGHYTETKEDRARWLYTAVTRASKSVKICV